MWSNRATMPNLDSVLLSRPHHKPISTVNNPLPEHALEFYTLFTPTFFHSYWKIYKKRRKR